MSLICTNVQCMLTHATFNAAACSLHVLLEMEVPSCTFQDCYCTLYASCVHFAEACSGFAPFLNFFIVARLLPLYLAISNRLFQSCPGLLQSCFGLLQVPSH